MVYQMVDGTKVFRLRGKDRCESYMCKGNLLVVSGRCEEGEKFYKVIASCDLCGTTYAFTRINRRFVCDNVGE